MKNRHDGTSVWLVLMADATRCCVRAGSKMEAAGLARREAARRWLDDDTNSEANRYFLRFLDDAEILEAALADGRGGRLRSLRRLKADEVTALCPALIAAPRGGPEQ